MTYVKINLNIDLYDTFIDFIQVECLRDSNNLVVAHYLSEINCVLRCAVMCPNVCQVPIWCLRYSKI